MDIKEAREILIKANLWRRYDGPIDKGPKMPDPKVLGIAIDTAIEYMLHPTWQDIKRIVKIADDLLIDTEYKWGDEEKYYQAILNHYELDNRKQQA